MVWLVLQVLQEFGGDSWGAMVVCQVGVSMGMSGG